MVNHSENKKSTVIYGIESDNSREVAVVEVPPYKTFAVGMA